MSTEAHKLYTDGGARGNPGPAGAGWILFDAQDKLVEFSGKYLGKTTNNQAEYRALLFALEAISKQVKKGNLKISQLKCHLDSELIVKQLTGVYKIKNKDFLPIVEKIKKLSAEFDKIEFVHVKREKNKFADKLVNIAIDVHEKN